ncbi:MAG: helix-hairpin-helix domain-containing protein [Candidatus Thorarchaeota archaeon]
MTLTKRGKKKDRKKKEAAQATLEELVEPVTKKKTSAKRSTSKSRTTKKSTKASSKASSKARTTKATKAKSTKTSATKTTTKKTKPKETKRTTKKTKSKPKETKRTTKKTKSKEKKATPKKTKAKPKEKVKTKEPVKESPVEGPSLDDLPGVGSKTRAKLIAAGYGSIEKIAKTRASALSKKIEGLSTDGADHLIKSAKKLLRESKEKPADFEEQSDYPSLTELPGVGKKLADRLVDAGYDSVPRLSRSRPQKVAAAISGLSVPRAAEIVAAAKDMMNQIQIARIVEPTPVIVATTQKTRPGKKPTKRAEPKSEPKEKTSKKTTKKEPKKVSTKRTATKKARTKKVTPVRKKPIRKKSGLPVPKAVTDLEAELKARWAGAAAREAAREEFQETVEVVALPREETIELLVEEAMEVLNEAITTGRPAFEIPSRSSDNIVWDEIRDLLLLGMKTFSRPYHSLASVVDATRTARVMEIVFNLLQSNLHATKREIYYSDVNLFRDQKYSDKIIEDVSSMLQTTRDSIHVVASARGSAMGRVLIRDGGDLIDLTKMGTGGWAITPFLDQVEIVESDAEFILLSEKDAAVMRLAEAKYWNRQPCIVLTGKGSGDMATRAFLKRLVKELEIPAFALVDSDPYGHYIYSVFLRGSKRLSYESPFIATPELKLLGVLSRDLDAYNIPKSVRIPMEPADIKRVKDMLKEPFVQANKEWVEDLKLMLKLKEKAEIQAFASHSFKYLTDEYLPTKLETGDWI